MIRSSAMVAVVIVAGWLLFALIASRGAAEGVKGGAPECGVGVCKVGVGRRFV